MKDTMKNYLKSFGKYLFILSALFGVFRAGDIYGKNGDLAKNLKISNLRLNDSILEFKKKINNLKLRNSYIVNQNKVKKGRELIVFNNTNKTKYFKYQDKLNGTGYGTPIPSKTHKIFNMSRSIYKWMYYNKSDYSKKDSLNGGEVVFKLENQRKIIVIDR